MFLPRTIGYELTVSLSDNGHNGIRPDAYVDILYMCAGGISQDSLGAVLSQSGYSKGFVRRLRDFGMIIYDRYDRKYYTTREGRQKIEQYERLCEEATGKMTTSFEPIRRALDIRVAQIQSKINSEMRRKLRRGK